MTLCCWRCLGICGENCCALTTCVCEPWVCRPGAAQICAAGGVKGICGENRCALTTCACASLGYAALALHKPVLLALCSCMGRKQHTSAEHPQHARVLTSLHGADEGASAVNPYCQVTQFEGASAVNPYCQ
eukprot:1158656-Pelagomonas_calceolata.AAC.16